MYCVVLYRQLLLEKKENGTYMLESYFSFSKHEIFRQVT